MSNVNHYRSRVFYFENKEDMAKFILMYSDMFHPYSKKSNDRIIAYGLDTNDYKTWYVCPADGNNRAMMDCGYVIRNKSLVCLLDKKDFMYILYGSGLTFEEVHVDYYRKLYKYVSEIGA